MSENKVVRVEDKVPDATTEALKSASLVSLEDSKPNRTVPVELNMKLSLIDAATPIQLGPLREPHSSHSENRARSVKFAASPTRAQSTSV